MTSFCSGCKKNINWSRAKEFVQSWWPPLVKFGPPSTHMKEADMNLVIKSWCARHAANERVRCVPCTFLTSLPHQNHQFTNGCHKLMTENEMIQLFRVPHLEVNITNQYNLYLHIVSPPPSGRHDMIFQLYFPAVCLIQSVSVFVDVV